MYVCMHVCMYATPRLVGHHGLGRCRSRTSGSRRRKRCAQQEELSKEGAEEVGKAVQGEPGEQRRRKGRGGRGKEGRRKRQRRKRRRQIHGFPLLQPLPLPASWYTRYRLQVSSVAATRTATPRVGSFPGGVSPTPPWASTTTTSCPWDSPSSSATASPGVTNRSRAPSPFASNLSSAPLTSY